MSTFQAPIRFFLGTHTPTGFVGTSQKDLYDPQDGWRVFLLKGGPGSGKSTLLKRLYATFADQEECEVFCCAGDPDSLDAVRIPGRKLCIIDATAPHNIDPRYWGAVEQPVCLSSCTNATTLHKQAQSIIPLVDEIGRMRTQCGRYLHAAATVFANSRRIQSDTLDRDKIHRLARRIALIEWGKPDTGILSGHAEKRFLSAVTPDGLVTFYETLQSLCPRIYAIEDEQGAAALCLLSALQQAAVTAGLRCITCPCPLFPNDGPEHLLLPSLGLAFTTSNSFHKADFPVFRRLHASRFCDREQLREKRQRLSFNRRAAVELLSEASSIAAAAKDLHHRLERYTTAAMDWEAYHTLCDTLQSTL